MLRSLVGSEMCIRDRPKSLQKMYTSIGNLTNEIEQMREDKQANIRRTQARRKRDALKEAEQSAGQLGIKELYDKYKELLHKYDKLKGQYDKLQADAEMRKESYQRQQSKLVGEMDGIRASISKTDEQRSRGLDVTMADFRDKHDKIQEKIFEMKDKTAAVLQEQEHDLLRAFRARMYDVTMQLEKERNQKDDGALEWIDKARALGKELDVYKMEAVRLDKENQRLQKENNRLRMQFKSQEEDRDELVRQVLALKRETAKLRQDLDRTQHQPKAPITPNISHAPAPRTTPLIAPSTSPALGKQEVESRYQDIIKRLKRLLEIERKNLRQVRTAHVQELAQRTELEAFLRQCIEDVKTEINRRRADMTAVLASDSEGSGLMEFSAADRERVMELLLSQERVINLLYDKTFPARNPGGEVSGGAAMQPFGAGHEMDAEASELLAELSPVDELVSQ
eukprot:TRINITY_DN20838_c0_g2_i1.p1 TRINITY_DN20838_c0_g2~~TRINITY_DN20838_c0_g2_i1.p1  ORF type:complete len:484 (-),score=169.91 TRINITY_DN20838_c0_g2_i1:287-1645(-)